MMPDVMDGGQGRRLKCSATIGDILLVGEQLRILMHTDNPHLVKDRRYLLRTYSNCFVGSETVDWLVETKQTPSREVAVYLMNVLLENHVFHHVSGDYVFKDENLFFRFCKDDGTYPWQQDIAISLTGQRLHNRLQNDRKSIMKDHEDGGQKFTESFQGCQLIDWLINNGDVRTREEGLKEGRRLLENDIIKHVSDNHHFKDEPLLYQFKVDFNRRFELLDLLLPTKNPSHLKPIKRQSPVASIEKKGLQIPKKGMHRAESGYHSLHGEECSSSLSTSESSAPSFGSHDSTDSKMQNLQITTNYLIRKATVKELEDSHSPYIKKHIRIASDPVGFGFVIRGEGPVYVKTVDPTGPAAQSGLRIGHFLYKVNDRKVVNMNHRELANVILSTMGYIRMVVMEYAADSR